MARPAAVAGFPCNRDSHAGVRGRRPYRGVLRTMQPVAEGASYSEPGRLVEIHETGVDRKTRGDAAANLPDCARGLGARLIAFGLVVPLRKIQRYGIEPFDPANRRDRCGHSAGSEPGRFSRPAPRGAYRALWSF